MTKLTADERCACGGTLVPPVLASGFAVPTGADYVCLGCGRAYRWTSSNPPTLTVFHTRHDVQFYSDDAVFFDRATRFVAPAVDAGRGVIVLATPFHREGLVQRLRSEGVNIEAAIRQGTYLSLDASDALSSITIERLPDGPLFRQTLADLIGSVAIAAKEPRVAVLGECVGLLCAEGNPDAAIALEQTGNELLAAHDLDILCAYPLRCCQPHDRTFQRICAEHASVDIR